MTTPLYFATVGGVLAGLAFQIGEATCFAMDTDPALYRVTPAMGLTLTARVSDDIAAFMATTVIEPRLLALAGKGA
jgi:hypothetical protein